MEISQAAMAQRKGQDELSHQEIERLIDEQIQQIEMHERVDGEQGRPKHECLLLRWLKKMKIRKNDINK